ncbi:MAG TPA: aminotransferase class III-fold pyridoxal phosphate-dependent enzyme, partial [Patescibacteria group bacterium]|nr:aminotransferase class III-fold pyridoxal phosphate-dependent enzyme [Patescibacteria group bacterium]
PLSGLWAEEALISPQAFPPGSTHSTYSSNPLGTAAALATLQWIEQQNYERTVAESGAYFLEQLEGLKKRHAVIGDVAGLGLALRIEVTQADRFTPNQPLANRIFERGLAGGIPTSRGPMGLVLNVTGYYKNVFGLAPCLDITKGEIDLAIELLDWLFVHCTEEP